MHMAVVSTANMGLAASGEEGSEEKLFRIEG
jgi:hypothetical protein